MMPNLYQLHPPDLWGDYGDILTSGVYHRDPTSGNMLIRRAGPFTPPISFPFCSPNRTVVVTDAFRDLLLRNAAVSVDFRPAAYEHIVCLAWHEWDRSTSLPRQRPRGSEPESYIAGQHCPVTAAAMECPWEVVPTLVPCVFASWLQNSPTDSSDKPTLLIGNGQYRGIFLPAEGHLPIVDRSTMEWLSSTIPEWVSFAPLTVHRDPDAQDRLIAKRRMQEEGAPHLSHHQYLALLLQYCEQNGFAVPPAISRPGNSVSRYCLVIRESPMPKISASTYSSLDSVSDYFEYRCRAGGHTDAITIHDLETGRALHYAGSRTYNEV